MGIMRSAFRQQWRAKPYGEGARLESVAFGESRIRFDPVVLRSIERTIYDEVR